MSSGCLRSPSQLIGRRRQRSAPLCTNLRRSLDDNIRQLHRPLLEPRPVPRHVHPTSRTFSTSPVSHVGAAMMPATRRQSTPSMAVMQKQAADKARRTGTIPDDIGLLENTFIMPRRQNRPGWFSDFDLRKRLEWARFMMRFREWVGALMYRYFMIRPRPRLHKGRIPGLARELHREMYACLANGNLAPVEAKVCQGLLGSLRKRVKMRPPNTRLEWTLHRYLSRPKLVSYKAAVVPKLKSETLYDANGVVQAVVRIHSLQSLRYSRRVSSRDAYGQLRVKEVAVDAQGQELQGVPDEVGGVLRDAKESTEYFVVQRSLRRGKEGPWMIWGTAQETSPETLREKESARKSRV